MEAARAEGGVLNSRSPASPRPQSFPATGRRHRATATASSLPGCPMQLRSSSPVTKWRSGSFAGWSNTAGGCPRMSRSHRSGRHPTGRVLLSTIDHDRPAVPRHRTHRRRTPAAHDIRPRGSHDGPSDRANPRDSGEHSGAGRIGANFGGGRGIRTLETTSESLRTAAKPRKLDLFRCPSITPAALDLIRMRPRCGHERAPRPQRALRRLQSWRCRGPCWCWRR